MYMKWNLPKHQSAVCDTDSLLFFETFLEIFVNYGVKILKFYEVQLYACLFRSFERKPRDFSSSSSSEDEVEVKEVKVIVDTSERPRKSSMVKPENSLFRRRSSVTFASQVNAVQLLYIFARNLEFSNTDFLRKSGFCI